MNKYLILALALISLSACKKPVTPNPQGPGPTLPGSDGNSTAIARTIKLDNGTHPNLYVYEDYRYDDYNRVSRYFSFVVDSSVTPARVDTVHAIHFLYENSDGSNNNTITLPTFSVENYRGPLYRLANAAHMYVYDNQNRLVLDSLIDFYRDNSSRGVTIARRMHYNGPAIIVDNLNLDTYTSQTGIYRDSILTDADGNMLKSILLNGKPYISDGLDDYKDAGSIYNAYSHNTDLENPLYKMNIHGVMAFVQTGFPGGDFYETFLSKKLPTTLVTHGQDLPSPGVTTFQYITNPLKGNRVEKTILSRPGTTNPVGFVVLNYR